MASSSSSSTPKLIIPEEKSSPENVNSRAISFGSSILPSATVTPPSNSTRTRKLTKILSTQTSFDRYHHHPAHPVAKRFSIDADPSSIILNTPISDFSSHSSNQTSTSDSGTSSKSNSLTNIIGKEVSPVWSPSIRQSDSFLEIPYEKGEIADLLKLADDPNAAAHITNDGHEVLLEHSAVPWVKHSMKTFFCYSFFMLSSFV